MTIPLEKKTGRKLHKAQFRNGKDLSYRVAREKRIPSPKELLGRSLTNHTDGLSRWESRALEGKRGRGRERRVSAELPLHIRERHSALLKRIQLQ